jgi:hypothetical protein
VKNKIHPGNSWQCKVCGEVFVVDSLARICELKHEGVVFPRAIDLVEKRDKKEE